MPAEILPVGVVVQTLLTPDQLCIAVNDLTSTFKRVRMKLNQIRSAAEKSSSATNSHDESVRADCQQLHMEITRLLSGVLLLLNSSDLTAELHRNTQFLKSMAGSIQGLIMDVGLIHKEPLLQKDIPSDSPVPILFSVQMDIQLLCLSMLAKFQSVSKGVLADPVKILQSQSAEMESLNLPAQYFLVILSDWFTMFIDGTSHLILKLLFGQDDCYFKRLQGSEVEIQPVLELSFWKVQCSVVKNFLNVNSDRSAAPQQRLFQLPFRPATTTNVNDSLPQVWNFIAQVVCTRTPGPVELNEFETFLEDLINSTISCLADADVSVTSERKLRKCLVRLVNILLAVGGVQDFRLLKSLWKYFNDKLNTTHFARDSDFGIASDSPACEWARVSDQMCNRQWLTNFVTDGLQKLSSFEIFLTIIGCLLTKDRQGNPMIRQFKSELFLKLHQRKMRELTDEGFFNLLMIFLILHQHQELELCRFTETIKYCEIKLDSSAKTGLLFRFYATFVGISLKRGQSFAECANHMRNFYDRLADLLHSTTNRMDLMKQKQMAQGLMHYIEGVKFILSEHGSEPPTSDIQTLIGASYQWVITRLNDSMADSVVGETLRVLELFHVILNNLSKVPSGDMKSAQPIVMHISSLLKSLAITQSLSDEMAESIAGCLTVVSQILQTHRNLLSPLKDPMDDVIGTQFCNTSVVAWYLAKLLADINSLQMLERRDSTVGEKLIRLWFVCGLSTEDEEWLEQTARLLPQISKLKELGLVGEKFKFKRNVVEVASVIFSTVNDRLQTGSEEAALRSFLHSTFSFLPEVVLRLWKQPSAKPIELALKLCGQLIRNCAPLIHEQGKSQLLLCRLLHGVLLCDAWWKQDKLSDPQLAALRDCLPDVIQGLCSLSPADPFVKGRMADLFRVYLPKFARSGANRPLSGTVHPMADAFLRCQQANPVGYKVFRKHVVTEVVAKLFTDRSYTVLITSLSQLIWFCEDLLQKTTCVETVKEEITSLLPCILSAAALAENKGIAMGLLELVDEMGQKFETGFLDVLGNSYRIVLVDSLPNKANRDALRLMTINLAKLIPGFSGRLAPIMESAVEKLEDSSGKGMDKTAKLFVQKVLETIEHRS